MLRGRKGARPASLSSAHSRRVERGDARTVRGTRCSFALSDVPDRGTRPARRGGRPRDRGAWSWRAPRGSAPRSRRTCCTCSGSPRDAEGDFGEGRSRARELDRDQRGAGTAVHGAVVEKRSLGCLELAASDARVSRSGALRVELRRARRDGPQQLAWRDGSAARGCAARPGPPGQAASESARRSSRRIG